MNLITINGKKYRAADIERRCTPVNDRLVGEGTVLTNGEGTFVFVCQVASGVHKLISISGSNRHSDRVLPVTKDGGYLNRVDLTECPEWVVAYPSVREYYKNHTAR